MRRPKQTRGEGRDVSSRDRDIGEAARLRVKGSFDAPVVARGTVELEAVPGLSEEWFWEAQMGVNAVGEPTGRLSIEEGVAGLVWYGSPPRISHIWVDEDVRRRGFSSALLGIYQDQVSNVLIFSEPLSSSGRALAKRFGSEVVAE